MKTWHYLESLRRVSQQLNCLDRNVLWAWLWGRDNWCGRAWLIVNIIHHSLGRRSRIIKHELEGEPANQYLWLCTVQSITAGSSGEVEHYYYITRQNRRGHTVSMTVFFFFCYHLFSSSSQIKGYILPILRVELFHVLILSTKSPSNTTRDTPS